MLINGIPDYRLPVEVVRREIKALEDGGLHIKTGIEIGVDLGYSEWASQFDAVILAVGRQTGKPLGVPGEDGPKQAVMQGIDFLRLSKSAKGDARLSPHDRVIVIGGGNTAIDSACSALRWMKKSGNGSPEVTLCYRRDMDEMPAFQSDVERARKEGVRFQTLLMPNRILANSGLLQGVEFLRCRLGETDGSGRKAPLPIPGSEVVIPCDELIIATGQSIKLPFDFGYGEKSMKEGRVGLAEGPPLFFLDDLGTVAEVIGAGHRMAQAVIEVFERKKKPIRKEAEEKIIRFEDLNPNYFEKRNPVPIGELSPEESVTGFKEIVQPYTPEEAKI